MHLHRRDRFHTYMIHVINVYTLYRRDAHIKMSILSRIMYCGERKCFKIVDDPLLEIWRTGSVGVQFIIEGWQTGEYPRKEERMLIEEFEVCQNKWNSSVRRKHLECGCESAVGRRKHGKMNGIEKRLIGGIVGKRWADFYWNTLEGGGVFLRFMYLDSSKNGMKVFQ